jgi:tetratricopeptide (TPR) repeat protein
VLNGASALERLRTALDGVQFDPADRKRREQAAALAVEAARLVGASQKGAAFALIEWACALLRRDTSTTEAERLFHWAAAAVLEGVVLPSLVPHAEVSVRREFVRPPGQTSGVSILPHVEHALRRVNEPRLQLARAVGLELRTFPDPQPKARLGQRDGPLFAQLVEALHRAATFSAVRAEALTRLGFSHLRDGHPERALAHLDDVPALTQDPWVLYLSHLFRGRAFEALGRDDEAVLAYRASVAAVPGAQSAMLALGSALFRVGAREDASAIAWAATAVPTVADPWVGYGQADLRFWPQIRDRLREAVR